MLFAKEFAYVHLELLIFRTGSLAISIEIKHLNNCDSEREQLYCDQLGVADDLILKRISNICSRLLNLKALFTLTLPQPCQL